MSLRVDARRWLRLVGIAVGTVAALVVLSTFREISAVITSTLGLSLSYRNRMLMGFLAALVVGLWMQHGMRFRSRAGSSSTWDRACDFVYRGPLPALVAGAILLMAATWVPHYLTWPWWADTDHFAVSALSWRAGILPYKDLVDYNFPGPTYLMWVLGTLFGWGRTWPFYAFDATWLGVVVVGLALWSRARFADPLPGLTAGLFLCALYLNLPVSEVAQRDWYTATLSLVAILIPQSSPAPRRRDLILSALAMALALATRPHAVLFLPAVALVAGGESGTPRERLRRALGWTCSFLAMGALAFLPLAAFGVLDDFLANLTYLRPGGPYHRTSFDDFLLRLFFARDDDGYRITTLGMAAILALAGPVRHQRASAVWLLALAGAALYLPISPVPHGYLRQPGLLFTLVALGFELGVVTSLVGLRAPVRLLAFATVLIGFMPGFPGNCDLKVSLRAVVDLARGKSPEEVPPGVTGMFYDYYPGPEEYPWNDYLDMLEYIRTETRPTTPVANVLRHYPNPPINGPVGRLSPFPHASGILWFRWIGPELEEDYARALAASTDAVVVWAPAETELLPSLALPRLVEVIRRNYQPEARFGNVEVWRRSPARGDPTLPR
ncbi:MAG: hypothetical protein AB7I30_12125 [Isosphaeraceae bacterium]